MVNCGEIAYVLHDYLSGYFASMSPTSGSKLSGSSHRQDPNRPGNGKRFKVKQGGSKFKGPKGVDPLYGKVPQIILHVVEFISPQQFAKVYNLNNHGRCPKSLKVPKDLKKSEVEAFFCPFVNKNGYKYMECGDPKFITFIKNLWMIIHQKAWLPTSWLIPLAMARGITCERKVETVMNWALFATWTKKE
jgi:hypothetical protein